MLKGKRGVTLLELVVAMGLASVIFLVLIAMMNAVYVSNSTASTVTRAQSIARLTLQQIEEQLRYADAIDLDYELPDPLNENHRYYYVNGGRLMEKSFGGTKTILGPLPGFEDFTCSVVFSRANNIINDKVLKVELTLYRRGKTVFTLSRRIYANNLVQGITGLESGTVLTFQSSMRSPVLVGSVVVSAPSYSITSPGATLQMSAQVFPLNATKRSVSWSVSPAGLAEITQEGLLTPLENGVVTVKASALDGSGVTGTAQIIIQIPG